MLLVFCTTAPVNLERLLQDTHQQVRLIRTDKWLNFINKQGEHSVYRKVFYFVVFAFFVVTEDAFQKTT